MKGSIRQRSPGSWELTVDMGRGPRGTRYRHICAIVAETPRVMARIDQAIESHGGGGRTGCPSCHLSYPS